MDDKKKELDEKEQEQVNGGFARACLGDCSNPNAICALRANGNCPMGYT